MGEETLTHGGATPWYNKTSIENKKGVYLARPFLINLACEGGQMSYLILNDLLPELQPNNAPSGTIAECAL
jgi:hypothetical protein